MTTRAKRETKRVGSARPSQLIYTFGVGSVVDLPNFSVIVAGIDDWERYDRHQMVIAEARLLEAVQANLGKGVKELRTAPWMEETRSPFDDWAFTGVPVIPFPRWLRCSDVRCNRIAPIDSGMFGLDSDHPFRPDLTQYYHQHAKRKTPAIPVRFVVACPNGHIDDFPWIEYAHRKAGGGICQVPILKLYDTGAGTRSTDMVVECESCGASAGLQAAFGDHATDIMPACRGREAHLRRFAKCDKQTVAMLLGASNAWFPITVSALSIPSSDDPLTQLLIDLWGELEIVDDREELDYELKRAGKKGGALVPLLDHDPDEIWEGITERRTDAEEDAERTGDLLGPEWESLTHPGHAPSTKDFSITDVGPPPDFAGEIERLVVAERLREVVAMLGFTRVDGPDSGVSSDLIPPYSAPLSRGKAQWVPATEIRGEGVFVQLPETAVVEWVALVAGSGQMGAMHDAHLAWRGRRNLDGPSGWPGERYVLLHSIAHLLINELALEAGYATASIRERIYGRDPSSGEPMAGFLLYTAAPDSEGTLGGLVAMGQPQTFNRILRQALDRAKLCSSDPHCAEHLPGENEDVLHAAACHACLFLPETSCERGNRYLDRNVLIESIADRGVNYFRI